MRVKTFAEVRDRLQDRVIHDPEGHISAIMYKTWYRTIPDGKSGFDYNVCFFNDQRLMVSVDFSPERNTFSSFFRKGNRHKTLAPEDDEIKNRILAAIFAVCIEVDT